MTQSTELDLGDVTEARRSARRALDNMTLGWDERTPSWVAVSTALDDNLALVAEVRRLRAQVERVEALAAEWERNERDADPWYWSDAAEEVRAALLEEMRASVDRMRAEDGLPPSRIIEQPEQP